MHEVCFCGPSGLLEDRAPIYLGDGAWGLACPRCGHVDDLRWLSEGSRREIRDVATQRQVESRSREHAALRALLPFAAAIVPPWEAAS